MCAEMFDPGYEGVCAGIERGGEGEDEGPVRTGTGECDDGVQKSEEESRVCGFGGVDEWVEKVGEDESDRCCFGR